MLPERRYNPLQDKYILISPHRYSRPWSGQTENIIDQELPDYDPGCYLCPGNKRVGEKVNPQYNQTFIFTNDFSALLPEAKQELKQQSTFFDAQPEYGTCEVICYHPGHNKTMASMKVEEITAVIEAWQKIYLGFLKDKQIKHVQIFENRGAEVGNSSPHPHGQAWAQESIPTNVQTELNQQASWYTKHQNNLLLEYLKEEQKSQERIIYENDHWIMLVPFWAEYPYEVLIIPKDPVTSCAKLNSETIKTLAVALNIMARMYAEFFRRPNSGAPYTMGIHQAPVDGGQYPYVQFHIHVQPPLLTPERIKFMVGYERFAEAQRDITPEQAAAQLREQIKLLQSNE